MSLVIAFVVLLTSLGATPTNPYPIDILIDKDHCLKNVIEVENIEANIAVEKMIEAAENDGIVISINSSFRDVPIQKELYKEDKANVAKIYCTEHHLAGVCDMAYPGHPPYHDSVQNKAIWKWLPVNAHKYGFVISYPEKHCPEWPKSNRIIAACGVDYKWEPWHIRYVGKKLAKKIFDAGYLDPDTKVIPQDFYVSYRVYYNNYSPAQPMQISFQYAIAHLFP